MSTTNLILLLLGAGILVGLLAAFGRVFGRTYMKFRGKRVITCPENQRPAGVVVNSGHILLTTIEGKPDLRLESCSRWPERQDCGQMCLRQIQQSPEGCLVRNILTHWYDGKDCVLCNKPIGEIRWDDHEPALLNPEGRSVAWHELAAERVPEVLATHRPVCWNCHIVNRMIGEHGDLLVDRSRAI